MANDVNQPKKNNWIMWLILIVVLILIGFYVFSKRSPEVTAEAASDSSTIESSINNNWTGIEPNLPDEKFDELADSDLTVRGNEQYAVYSIDETLIFDVGKNTIKPAAEGKLNKIISSAEKRFPNGDIRIYGYTDAQGSAEDNKKLAEERVEAVKAWILKNGNIAENRISLNPVGEGNPVASNDTKSGRQKNRRVEIAIKKK